MPKHKYTKTYVHVHVGSSALPQACSIKQALTPALTQHHMLPPFSLPLSIRRYTGCIYKLVSEKTAALATAVGRKALGKGALLEIESLKHVDHKGSVFLSEVELRSTAIFASGETTGRAILHTLRARQRIKVVRSGGENTFVLL